MVLTFDVGGTFVKWALADGEEFVQRGKFPTPQGSFDQLVEAVQSVWDALDTVPDGMAFSVPGTVDVANGIIRQGIEDVFRDLFAAGKVDHLYWAGVHAVPEE